MASWNFVFFFFFPQSRHCIRPSSFEWHSTQLSSSPADPFPPFSTFTAHFCSLVHVKLLGTGTTPHRVSLDNPQVHADEMEETQNTWWLDARWDHIRKGKTEKERPLTESCTTAATRTHPPHQVIRHRASSLPRLTVVFISTLVALPGL